METYERHEFPKGMLDRKPEGWRYDRFLFREMSERLTRLLERRLTRAEKIERPKLKN
jgi:hypothetical protein